jgi:putative phosphoribosyl transferase
MSERTTQQEIEHMVEIPSDLVTLTSILTVPRTARGIVLFAHGSGRHSPRNRYATRVLGQAGMLTRPRRNRTNWVARQRH